jgi:PhnB protein
MKTANPYLNFPGNTKEAFEFYRSVFGGEFVDVLRFRDMGDTMGVPESQLDGIAHISLPLGPGNILMGTDQPESWGQPLRPGNNFYIAIEADDAEEADRLFGGLSAGGRVEMPLQKTSWAEKYGSCVDRYDVQWMVMYTGDVQFSPGQGS